MRKFFKIFTSFIVAIVTIYMLKSVQPFEVYVKEFCGAIMSEPKQVEGIVTKRVKAEDEYFISPDKIKNIEEMSISNKIAGLLILRKLDEKDRNRVIGIFNEGITFLELKELEEIAAESLDEDDIQILKEILVSCQP